MYVAYFAGAYLLIKAVIETLPSRDTPHALNKKVPAGNTLLAAMIEEYVKLLVSKNIEINTLIRANVMILRFGFFRRFMRIAYFATLDPKVKYNPEEKEMQWTKNNGAVGHVWRAHTVETFCSSDQESWEKLISTLTAKQRPVVSLIKSVICAPVFDDSGEKVIAIITLDSRSDSSQSIFGDTEVQGLLTKYVDVLKPLCPNHGCTVLGR